MKRILVTRARAQADEFVDKLRAAGFDPVYFPVIEIKPVENNLALERALSKLNCYEWVVFSSVNAVDVVFDVIARSVATKQSPVEEWRLLRSARSDALPKFAAIGPKTAEALNARGVMPDFVPEEYVAESILRGLGDLFEKWVLLPRAEIARQELPQAIFKAGGVPHEITVYKTLPAQPDVDGLAALKSGVDIITFTSASTVENFVAILRKNQLDPLNLPSNPLIACIGPLTEQTARNEGFQNILVAKEFTTEGLIRIISTPETL